MLKRIFLLVFIVIFLTSCSATRYKDGVYYSEAPEFPSSGWKETVEITIEKGKLTKINWDAIYKDDTIPIKKKQYSRSGLYGMLAQGANDEWYDQANAAQHFILENGIDALVVNEDGVTDSVASCSIHVNTLDKLLRECLEKAKK